MSARIASIPIRAIRRVEIIIKKLENRDLRSEIYYKLFKCLQIARPATLPVAQLEVKLNPPVSPSTFNTSPAKYNHREIFDSIVLGFTSSVLTHPAVTNSSPGRLWIREMGKPCVSIRQSFLRSSSLSSWRGVSREIHANHTKQSAVFLVKTDASLLTSNGPFPFSFNRNISFRCSYIYVLSGMRCNIYGCSFDTIS
jgi:hypothetical protein